MTAGLLSVTLNHVELEVLNKKVYRLVCGFSIISGCQGILDDSVCARR